LSEVWNSRPCIARLQFSGFRNWGCSSLGVWKNPVKWTVTEGSLTLRNTQTNIFFFSCIRQHTTHRQKRPRKYITVPSDDRRTKLGEAVRARWNEKQKTKRTALLDSSATNYPLFLQSNSLFDQLQFALRVIEWALGNWGPCEDKDANVTAFVKAPWRNDTDALSLEFCWPYPYKHKHYHKIWVLL